MSNQIFKGVFRYEGLCSCYYLDDKVKILVDAGAFLSKPVSILILTHCHYDHIAFAAQIQQETGCKIACGEKEKEAIESLGEKTVCHLYKKRIKPFKIDITLKDGDVIDTESRKLVIFETPGHTDGSISVYDANNQILFSGDLKFEGDLVGRTDLPSGERKQLQTSLKKVEKLKVRILCPGH